MTSALLTRNVQHQPEQMTNNPRPTKTGRHSPAQSEALRKLWQNPAYRSKMIAARHRSTKDRRKDPQKYSRVGVPTGMRRAEAMALWDTAGQIADNIVKALEADGVLPEAVIPDSDDAVAKACLRELAVIVFGPGKDLRTKLMALHALLKYTKARPTCRIGCTVTGEEWLRKAMEECRSDLRLAASHTNEMMITEMTDTATTTTDINDCNAVTADAATPSAWPYSACSGILDRKLAANIRAWALTHMSQAELHSYSQRQLLSMYLEEHILPSIQKVAPCVTASADDRTAT
jgi:hypothetical protein